jgi:hypothetical protein
MIWVLGLLNWAMLGAFGRRVAGGVMGDDWHIWKVPHLLATGFYGVVGGVAGYLGTGNWAYGLCAGFGLWLGHILGLHKSAGMGWTKKPTAQMGALDQATRAQHPSWYLPSAPIYVSGVVMDTTSYWDPMFFGFDLAGMFAYGAASVVLPFIFVLACPLGHSLRAWPLLAGALAVPCIYAFTTWLWSRDPVGAGRWPKGFGPSLGLAEWLTGAALVGALYLG